MARHKYRKKNRDQHQRTWVGKVQKNPRGFAFILPSEKNLPDAYVSRDDARLLLNGDVVEFSVVREGRKTSARIHRILERGQTDIVGVIERQGKEFFLVTPEGEGHWIERPPPNSEKQWAIAHIEEYPSRRSPGFVSIKTILGKELVPKFDYPIAIARHGLEDTFSDQALKEGERLVKNWRPEAGPDRRDLRELPFVTIDGEDAKDYDDAVFVECNQHGSAYVLYVSIADVSHFVTPGSELDRVALKRGTSVYFPGFCLPMLPESLSNNLCSLLPEENRYTLTAEMHFDREGNPTKSEFYESLICTARRMTYKEVDQFFHQAPEVQELLRPLEKPLTHLRELYRLLLKKRFQRGVLEFDLPECKVELNREGEPEAIYRASRLESHRVIEEFMIAANRAVAKALKESHIPTLYRIHEPPDPANLDELNRLLKALGMPRTIQDISPKTFSKLLEATSKLKGAQTIHQVVLRLQKQAKYHPDPLGHFGLALADYAHFTSPIRRYPDLVVHRSLKRLISGAKRTEKRGEEDYYAELGARTSASERKAVDAERYAIKRKQCWYMKRHLGDTFEGQISSLNENGLFVLLPDLVVEGFLPLELLNGRYEFDDWSMNLRKRPGNATLSVGDAITIQVANVSIEETQILFREEGTL